MLAMNWSGGSENFCSISPTSRYFCRYGQISHITYGCQGLWVGSRIDRKQNTDKSEIAHKFIDLHEIMLEESQNIFPNQPSTDGCGAT